MAPLCREPRDGVDVAACAGSADEQQRHPDVGCLGGRAAAAAAAAPVGVSRRVVAHPLGSQGLHGAQALEPLVSPLSGADGSGVRGLADSVHEPGAPREVLAQEAAALVVHVVLEAAVGAADGHGPHQSRVALHGGLQGRDAAPGAAHHEDLAAAPGLARCPVDGSEGVGLLPLAVLVVEDPVAVAAASAVHADADDPVACEVRVHHGVDLGGAVRAAVGEDLDGDEAPALAPPAAGDREPHPGCEAALVVGRHPGQRDLLDLKGKVSRTDDLDVGLLVRTSPVQELH